MRLVILYRPDSEHARAVESFIHDFKLRNPAVHIEIQNVDEREGIATATVYDIMRYPAILALSGEGAVLKFWEGIDLPLLDEVASYGYSG